MEAHNPTPPSLQDKICELYDDDVTPKEIAQRLNIDLKVVHQIIDKVYVANEDTTEYEIHQEQLHEERMRQEDEDHEQEYRRISGRHY